VISGCLFEMCFELTVNEGGGMLNLLSEFYF
jgi:hypothetical protein